MRRLPIYALALWVAVTVAYALPRLAWRGSLRAPPPTGPFWGGYWRFLREVATGHLGLGAPGVASTLENTLPFSLALVGIATLIAFAIGGLLGLIAAWRRAARFDGSVTTGTAILWTVPAFALAGLALEFFGVQVAPLPRAVGRTTSTCEPAWTWTLRGQRGPARRAAADRPRRRECRPVGR